MKLNTGNGPKSTASQPPQTKGPEAQAGTTKENAETSRTATSTEQASRSLAFHDWPNADYDVSKKVLIDGNKRNQDVAEDVQNTPVLAHEGDPNFSWTDVVAKITKNKRARAERLQGNDPTVTIAAKLSPEELAKSRVRIRREQNIIVLSTPDIEPANRMGKAKTITLKDQQYEIPAESVISGIGEKYAPEYLMGKIRATSPTGPAVFYARMMEQRDSIPRLVLLGNAKYRCRPYLPKEQVCDAGLGHGHRKDVCPHPEKGRCAICGCLGGAMEDHNFRPGTASQRRELLPPTRSSQAHWPALGAGGFVTPNPYALIASGLETPHATQGPLVDPTDTGPSGGIRGRSWSRKTPQVKNEQQPQQLPQLLPQQPG
ncbi:hypothetical protein HPB47_000615 [Ixodes persulcatus]|uniref:Uncharacterized protein n=1 Tax=Ixodes persulcatus TaxID=34615 RepID=A0AC60PR88_IXOPE|nr:hypothetical protein HPB47_000615 [Ixodes persulcatus]